MWKYEEKQMEKKKKYIELNSIKSEIFLYKCKIFLHSLLYLAS